MNPYGELAKYGILGVVLGWFMYTQMQTQDKLFSVIENNTVAITKLTEKIDNFMTPNKLKNAR